MPWRLATAEAPCSFHVAQDQRSNQSETHALLYRGSEGLLVATKMGQLPEATGSQKPQSKADSTTNDEHMTELDQELAAQATVR